MGRQALAVGKGALGRWGLGRRRLALVSPPWQAFCTCTRRRELRLSLRSATPGVPVSVVWVCIRPCSSCFYAFAILRSSLCYCWYCRDPPQIVDLARRRRPSDIRCTSSSLCAVASSATGVSVQAVLFCCIGVSWYFAYASIVHDLQVHWRGSRSSQHVMRTVCYCSSTRQLRKNS